MFIATTRLGLACYLGARTRGEGAGTPPLKYGVLGDVLFRNFTLMELILSKALWILIKPFEVILKIVGQTLHDAHEGHTPST